jgi:opacity protein-like surface antigen
VAATDENDVSDSDDFDAYMFGVGGIYSVGQNLLLTVEGTYSDFDKQDYDTFSFDADETRVTVGLAYRFDI